MAALAAPVSMASTVAVVLTSVAVSMNIKSFMSFQFVQYDESSVISADFTRGSVFCSSTEGEPTVYS